mmetsp:Transcript_24173/g.60777  ORF Transcript_24173/g.60777 Transcript_24173/m.60777 type:complete len:315 (-) Transcript_24173:2167-3111(-)
MRSSITSRPPRATRSLHPEKHPTSNRLAPARTPPNPSLSSSQQTHPRLPQAALHQHSFSWTKPLRFPSETSRTLPNTAPSPFSVAPPQSRSDPRDPKVAPMTCCHTAACSRPQISRRTLRHPQRARSRRPTPAPSQTPGSSAVEPRLPSRVSPRPLVPWRASTRPHCPCYPPQRVPGNRQKSPRPSLPPVSPSTSTHIPSPLHLSQPPSTSEPCHRRAQSPQVPCGCTRFRAACRPTSTGPRTPSLPPYASPLSSPRWWSTTRRPRPNTPPPNRFPHQQKPPPPPHRRLHRAAALAMRRLASCPRPPPCRRRSR